MINYINKNSSFWAVFLCLFCGEKYADCIDKTGGFVVLYYWEKMGFYDIIIPLLKGWIFRSE